MAGISIATLVSGWAWFLDASPSAQHFCGVIVFPRLEQLYPGAVAFPSRTQNMQESLVWQRTMK